LRDVVSLFAEGFTNVTPVSLRVCCTAM
jgi:hypothetical protein